MTVPQTFVIDKKFGQLMKVSVGVFLAFTLLGIALPFLPDDASAAECSQPASPIRTYIVSVVCTLFFAALALYSLRILKALPLQSVAADEDGLWLAHLSKGTGLVRWQDIATLRERPIFQRLDLMGEGGNVLLKLEYQLTQFSQLRSLVMDRTSGQAAMPSLPVTAAKRPIYHLFYALGLVGFGALGWKVGPESPWLGYVGMTGLVAVIAYEYLTTISRVTIDRECLVVAYPTVQRTYPWTDINSVQLSDVFDQNGVMHPQLNVTAKGCEKPFRLHGLGMDAVALHRLVMAAWKDEPHDPQPGSQQDAAR
jgi:hypothetical protein